FPLLFFGTEPGCGRDERGDNFPNRKQAHTIPTFGVSNCNLLIISLKRASNKNCAKPKRIFFFTTWDFTIPEILFFRSKMKSLEKYQLGIYIYTEQENIVCFREEKGEYCIDKGNAFKAIVILFLSDNIFPFLLAS